MHKAVVVSYPFPENVSVGNVMGNGLFTSSTSRKSSTILYKCGKLIVIL